MIYLIGLGLDEGDLTLKAIDCLKKSNKIYAEFYTNVWHGGLENIEKIIGKQIVVLEREKVESDFLIKDAKNADVSLLVSGDPLSATTHFELVALAKQNNIKVQIIHAPSVYTAVAQTGLQLYKFGRSTTLPIPQKGYEPKSPYDVIKSNKKLGYHTLVLLDIGMTVNEGIEILSRLDIDNLLDKLVVCTKLGSNYEKIIYDKKEDIKNMEIKDVPAVIIVPGIINFKEEEYLQNL